MTPKQREALEFLRERHYVDSWKHVPGCHRNTWESLIRNGWIDAVKLEVSEAMQNRFPYMPSVAWVASVTDKGRKALEDS